MNKIFITGDTHIPIDISKLNSENFPQQKVLTKDDYVVILGDFGLFWHNNKTYQFWKDWLESRNFTTLWVDGNHENFNWINNLPTFSWNGGMVHKTEAKSSIIHLMRGNLYKIGIYNILSAGGAQSYDRHVRTEGISYWKGELWDFSEEKRIFDLCDKIKKEDITVDFVFSHTCPSHVVMPISGISPYEDFDPTTQLLDEVENLIDERIRGWFFGHWHVDRKFGKYHCLYSSIRRIA